MGQTSAETVKLCLFRAGRGAWGQRVHDVRLSDPDGIDRVRGSTA